MLFSSIGTGYGEISIDGISGIKMQNANANWFFARAGNFSNTGNSNIAIGPFSMQNSVAPIANTFLGFHAGTDLISAEYNTGLGNLALYRVTDGSYNTAVGSGSLKELTTGSNNTAVGENTLATGTDTSFCTALGNSALSNSTGSFNLAFGSYAGTSLTTGSQNTFIGPIAGSGAGQKADATNTTAIGFGVVTTSDNQTIVGNTGVTSIALRGDLKLEYGADVYGEINHNYFATSMMYIHSNDPVYLHSVSNNLILAGALEAMLTAGSSITMTSTIGIGMTAGQNMNLTSLTGNITLSAEGSGHSIIMTSAGEISATAENDIIITSSNGEVSLTAETDIGLTASLGITLTAGTDINLTATSGVYLTAETDINLTATSGVYLTAETVIDMTATETAGIFANSGMTFQTNTGNVALRCNTTGNVSISTDEGSVNISTTYTGAPDNDINLTAARGDIMLTASNGLISIKPNDDLQFDITGHHRWTLAGINSYTNNATALSGLGSTNCVYYNSVIGALSMTV
jgi:uncharacterized protein (DUF2345 family)